MTEASLKGKIFVTPHAIDRAIELFDFDDRRDAMHFIREGLRESTFISEIVGETGKVDRLFAKNRLAFVVDRTEDVVITVYIREVVDKELRGEVQEAITQHLASLIQSEKELEDALLSLEIRDNIDQELIARGEQPFHDWRELQQLVTELQNKLDALRAKRSRVAKGAVAFL